MMKYRIDEHGNGIDISVGDVGGDGRKLLEAFRECQEGRCSCPTEEYKKLDSLEVEQNAEGIQLHLKSRQGEAINTSEIERCLDYTAERVKKKD
jgi:hypothetical protein